MTVANQSAVLFEWSNQSAARYRVTERSQRIMGEITVGRMGSSLGLGPRGQLGTEVFSVYSRAANLTTRQSRVQFRAANMETRQTGNDVSENRILRQTP